MPPDVFAHLVLGVALTVGAVVILRGPLGRAIAERMAGRREVADERLQSAAVALDALRAELGEIHERLDFTERLLARQREAGRLPLGEAATKPREGAPS